MAREMKDSGIEWIGKIPEHWEVRRLKNIGDVIIGLTYSPEEVTDEGTLVLRSSNIQNGKIEFGDNVYVNKYIPEKLFVRDGDILICSRNGSKDLIGKCTYIVSETSGHSFGAFMSVFRSEYNRFLFHVFNSPIFSFHIGTFFTSTINQLTTSNLNGIQVPIPTPSEQTDIAYYLDWKCSLIDSIIEKQKAVIEKLKLYKQSIITEAVTKGLDPTVKMKPSGIEWIGDIPEGWEVTPLTKQLDSIIDYRGKTPKKVDEGVFLVTAKNIKDGKINYEASKEFVLLEEYEEIMHRGRPEIGDVLLTTEAPLGEVANVDRTDIALAQRIIKFRASNHKLDNYYLKYWLISRGFNSFLLSLSTGSTAAGIKASKLFMLPIILPSIPEQRVIVEYLDNKCVLIDNSIDKKQNLIDKLTEYKQSLIYECVTGKREVV